MDTKDFEQQRSELQRKEEIVKDEQWLVQERKFTSWEKHKIYDDEYSTYLFDNDDHISIKTKLKTLEYAEQDLNYFEEAIQKKNTLPLSFDKTPAQQRITDTEETIHRNLYEIHKAASKKITYDR